MSYIFLDESGDLGFDFKKKKTTKYFVITFLFAKDKKGLEKIIKKSFASMPKKEARRHNGVIHAYKEQPKTIQKILNDFSSKDFGSIISIYLNKQKVFTKLQDEKHVLYNYVVNILLDRVFTKKLIPINEKIEIIASHRETNKFLNENFCNYLKNKSINKHSVDISIEIKYPRDEKSLQLADVLSWSIFRKRERQDEQYYNIIKNKIVEENPLFP